jgi:hypothetical protein
MSNAETNARKFDAKAIEEWAKYGHSGNVQFKENAEWWDRAAAREWAKVEAEQLAEIEAEEEAFRMCSTDELFSMGLIDEATMRELAGGWETPQLAQAA